VKAVLTVLGETPSAGYFVSITSFDGGSLAIANAPVLTLGSPVKVLDDDCLWLGEVTESHPDGVALIEVSHSLSHPSELSLLAERFTGRAGAASAADRPQPERTLS
jgi:hypothetical protein